MAGTPWALCAERWPPNSCSWTVSASWAARGLASLLSVTAASLAYSLTIRRLAHASEDSHAELQIEATGIATGPSGRDGARPDGLDLRRPGRRSALALEVIWFRFLSMYVLTTTLTMSVLLAVVLAGIGLGGLAASRWMAGGVRCASIAFLAGCSTALSYIAFQWLTHGAQIADWYSVAWLACALTGATSFLSGVLFTLFGQALRDVSVAADRVGVRAAAWLTLVNTTGAMCGAPIAAFVLLPWLGMERSIFGVAALYGAIGALAMADRCTSRTRRDECRWSYRVSRLCCRSPAFHSA